MTAAIWTEQVLKILNDSSIDYTLDQFSSSEIFELAKQKKRLLELQLAYKEIKPAGSKLKNDYHWMNLKSALEADLESEQGLQEELSQNFVNYYINYGKKYLLIEKTNFSDATLKEIRKIEVTTPDDWRIDKEQLYDSNAPDSALSPLEVISYRKDSANNHCFLLYETVGTFAYESASLSLLSDAGKQFKDQIMLKKRTVIPGLHRVIISHDFKYRIIMIDPCPLTRTDTPPERALSCLSKVFAFCRVNLAPSDASSSVFFFNAIQKLYEDNTVGKVTEGCFSTSTGSVFTNNSRGRNTDLRIDPFQKGGTIADDGHLNFTKLRIEWNQNGNPRVFMNGSSDMFFKPDKSLPFIRITFEVASKKNTTDFLKKVLENADW